ncbi:MAG: PEP-CTERM sorting domain-containing protein [Thiobacillus sp.]
MIKVNGLCKGLVSGLLLLAANSVYALPVTYNFSFTGSVTSLGSNVVYRSYDTTPTVAFSTISSTPTTNLFGFTALPSTITASGIFTVNNWGSSYTGTVNFDAASGNTLKIVGGNANTTLYASDDTSYLTGGFPALHFTNGQLDDFDYKKTTVSKFNSNFLTFDDATYVAPLATGVTGKTTGKNWTEYRVFNAMAGTWSSNLAVSPVPEASTYAMMLAGLGLVGLMGAARRKSLALPA